MRTPAVKSTTAVAALLLSALLAGCGGSDPAGKPAAKDAAGKNTPAAGPLDPALAKVMLGAEPGSAKDALEVRRSAKDDETVVVEGFIRNWNERAAPFELVSTTLTPCHKNPDEKCPDPWDFCCDKWMDSLMAVDPVGGDGKPLKGKLFGEGGLKRNDRIVVQAKVKKDANGNITLLATGIFNKGGGLKE